MLALPAHSGSLCLTVATDAEAGIPPLNLYLAYRRAVFLSRPDYQAKAQAIRSAVRRPRPFTNYHPPIPAPPRFVLFCLFLLFIYTSLVAIQAHHTQL